MTPEAEALAILRDKASDEVTSWATKLVEDGSHMWVRDPFGMLGLVTVRDHEFAVIVVYPAAANDGVDDFAIDEVALEGGR